MMFSHAETFVDGRIRREELVFAAIDPMVMLLQFVSRSHTDERNALYTT